MTRELKFRVWFEPSDEYKKEEIELGRQMPEDIYAVFYSSDDLFDDTWCNLNDYKHEPIIEQYTGIKDKNGKEIYEGDIVNIQGIKYYVDFEHGGFWFNNDNRKWKANRPFTHFQEINDTEVIGNIHESNMEELCQKG